MLEKPFLNSKSELILPIFLERDYETYHSVIFASYVTPTTRGSLLIMIEGGDHQVKTKVVKLSTPYVTVGLYDDSKVT